jgi:DNA-binding IclR family transcriptional regulator
MGPKVVIMGAGIVGTSLAEDLTARTDVTVIDRGSLFATGGSPSRGPWPGVSDQFVADGERLRRLHRRKILRTGVPGGPVFDRVGGLEVATTAERWADLHRKAGWAQAWATPGRLLSPAECLELHPLPDHRAILGGFHTPTDGLADGAGVDHALLVLEFLAELGKGGVTEIADELGVHKSTVSRLIAALESCGYVEQLSEHGKYQLSIAVSRLVRSRSGHLDLVKLSQDASDTLAAESGETANLAILDKNRAVKIVEAVSTAEIALQTSVGQSCPAHATSIGKVLLAGLDADEVRNRLGTTLEGFTENTHRDHRCAGSRTRSHAKGRLRQRARGARDRPQRCGRAGL